MIAKNTFRLMLFLSFIIAHNLLAQEWENQVSGTTEDLNDVFFWDSNTGWVVGENSTIAHTSDAGDSWTAQTSPIDTASLIKIQFLNPSNGYIAGNTSQGGIVLHSDDGGNTWTFLYHLQGYSFTDFTFINPDTGWITGGDIFSTLHPEMNPGIILRTVDGGETWDLQFEQYVPSDADSASVCHAVDFSDEYNGLALCDAHHDNFGSTRLFRTLDGGITWDYVSTIETPVTQIASFMDTVWAGGRYSFTNSTNYGVDWKFDSDLFNLLFFVPSIEIIDGNTGWLLGWSSISTGSNSIILFTNDNWESWSIVLSDQYPKLRNIFSIESDELWAVGEAGLILHYLGGVIGIASPRIKQIDQLRLAQNYPNPFNSNTSIKFDLPSSMHAQMNVFDMQGREVIQLFRGILEQGYHDYTWDGKTVAGFDVPSGIYIYRLTIRGRVKTKKMTILK
ncbi:YCF48-related protein [Candidatus Neomarinimicrobiota bacterium]